MAHLPRINLGYQGDDWHALALAFAMGFAVVPVLLVLVGTVDAIVTDSAVTPLAIVSIFVIAALAGFASEAIYPGWRGVAACACGLTVFTALEAAYAGFSGLQFLQLVGMLPLVAVGAGSATIVRHIRSGGLRDAVRRPVVWLAAVFTLAVVAIWISGIVLIYGSGSPP